MNEDLPNGNRSPNANQPPVEVNGEFFYQNPDGRDVKEVVMSREPGRYPPGHEAPMRHPEAAQQVMVHQQPLPMLPQQDYMAPPMNQQQFMYPQMTPQQNFTAPEMVQQQGFMGPMMPQPPIIVTGQEPWRINAPPQPSMMNPWGGMVAQPAQHQGGYPTHFAYPPQPLGFVPIQQVNDGQAWNQDGQQQSAQNRHNWKKNPRGKFNKSAGKRQGESLGKSGSDEQTQTTPLDEPPTKKAVESPPTTPQIHKLKLFPGDKMLIEETVKLQTKSGEVEIQASPESPAFLVHRSDNSYQSVQEKVKTDKKSVQEQQAQTEKQEVQVPLILEESVQQPTQPNPVTERLVHNPDEQPDVESNEPVVQEPNTCDAATLRVGESVQTYAEIARSNQKPNSEVQADRPVVINPAVTSIQYVPKQGHVQESLKVVTQTERPRQSDLGETQKQKVEPQAEPTWTVAKPSRGPSIRHVRPETVVKTVISSKQSSIGAVKVQENLQTENQDPPADVPTGTESSATAKKKSKKPGKPTQSKAEREAQERAASEAFEEALASAHEESVFQKPVVDYIESHTSIRATIVKEGLGADCVDTEDFEHSLLTHFVQNKSTNWQSEREEVRKFLQKNRDAIRTSESAEDQELVQNYKLLLDKLCPVIIQDFLAIRALHQANLTQTLEKEYFKLIHNPDRTVLVLNCLTEEIRRAPRSQKELQLDVMITMYVNRQETIRADGNMAGVDENVWMETYLNAYFNLIRNDFVELLANNRETLVKTYYRFWNWQYRQMKESLPRDRNYEEKLAFAYSLASRDVSGQQNNVLLCDAEMLSGCQKRLFQTAPLDQLLEHSKRYCSLIFCMQ